MGSDHRVTRPPLPASLLLGAAQRVLVSVPLASPTPEAETAPGATVSFQRFNLGRYAQPLGTLNFGRACFGQDKPRFCGWSPSR